MNVLSAIYYLGIIACGMQGSEKSQQQHMNFSLSASFVSALGGGMFRDLVILFVFPIALTKKCIPDVTIALCAGILYQVLLRKHWLQNIIKQFVFIADALGLGTFIAIGIDRALAFGASQTIAFYCGIITALGSGILSSLMCGQCIYKILTSNIGYRIITILGSFIYINCLTNGVNPTTAQSVLILYTVFFVLIYNFKSLLIKYCMNAFRYRIVKCLPIPMAVILYQLKFKPYIPYELSVPQCFSTFNNIHGKDLYHIKYKAILLTYNILYPRRFARGR